MNRVEFRNKSGNLIGWTQENPAAKQIYGYRAPGTMVGIYYETMGITFRTNGQRYGTNNQLAALISEKEC